MPHASRILDQLEQGANNPDVSEEQRERLTEKLRELSDMHDLTGFQRDLLRGIAALTTENPKPPKGLSILEWLEDKAGYTEVHHGRLYPNLNTLVDMGLVNKSKRDQRTNQYELTTRGRRDIGVHLSDWTDAVAGLDDVNVAATDGGK